MEYLGGLGGVGMYDDVAVGDVGTRGSHRFAVDLPICEVFHRMVYYK